MTAITPSTMGEAVPFSSYSEAYNANAALTESGYASVGSAEDEEVKPEPEIIFSKAHLRFLNKQLQFLEPEGLLPLQIVMTINTDLCRNPEMVHHNSPPFVPNHGIRAHWPCHT